MHQRNAARVLPLPVGARMSVDSPRAMAGQPSVCAMVGALNDAQNQSRTGAWKGWRERRTSRGGTTSILRRRHGAGGEGAACPSRRAMSQLLEDRQWEFVAGVFLD